ncbi:MAG: hypothetical protein ACQEVA_17220 [Myxococcota bacterium]
MPRSHTEIATSLAAALLILGLTGTAWAWWPRAENPHTQTVHTSVPDHPERQYSFEFGAAQIDSMAWSSVFGTPPGGQVGDLEGMNRAQAVAFANATSKRAGHEACYRLDTCDGDPADSGFSCETIEPESISCRGFRLPTARELELLDRTDRRTRFVQWSHEGQLVDNRRVRGTDDNLRELAGFMLVRTVAYE